MDLMYFYFIFRIRVLKFNTFKINVSLACALEGTKVRPELDDFITEQIPVEELVETKRSVRLTVCSCYRNANANTSTSFSKTFRGHSTADTCYTYMQLTFSVLPSLFLSLCLWVLCFLMVG